MPVPEKSGRRTPIKRPAKQAKPPVTWDNVDVSAATMQVLHNIAGMVGQAKQASEGRRPAEAQRGASGVVALFAGPDSANQAATAEALAHQSGLPLLRVSLSEVVSKYIGETEKNLRRIIDEAQASNAILFFDEADALFGKRSEVKDSHDRYANIEINFLLQRLEEFQGLAIIATNIVQRLDPTLKTRFGCVVRFPPKA